MSLHHDLAYHEAMRRQFAAAKRETVTFKADRLALATAHHFIEFYDHGAPAPTGILLTPHRLWVVMVGESYFWAPVGPLRAWCYRRWSQRSGPMQGGDSDAFWGVRFPLSRFGKLACERLSEAEVVWVATETARLIASPPPIEAARTLDLFATVPPDDGDDEP